MTTLFLVRHGKTESSGKRLCGNLRGIHLNEFGKQQAEIIANYVAEFPIKAIFSSPLERTMETAMPLVQKTNLTITPQEFLREIDFGDFQGKGEELLESPIWKEFNEHPAKVRFPNGETIHESQKRVVEGLDKLCSEFSANDQIVIVSHCEALRLAVAFALGAPIDAYQRLTIDPGSITRIEWQDGRYRLLSLNVSPIS
ncbi:MAG: phosphoglycerate mutase [Anaerolinea sp.]|nr:phosphoglycerate mutase [Anaerolinea sp.]